MCSSPAKAFRRRSRNLPTLICCLALLLPVGLLAQDQPAQPQPAQDQSEQAQLTQDQPAQAQPAQPQAQPAQDQPAQAQVAKPQTPFTGPAATRSEPVAYSPLSNGEKFHHYLHHTFGP